MIGIFAIVIIGKVIIPAGIPSYYHVYDSLLYIWGPHGDVFRINLKTETFERLKIEGERGEKFIFSTGKKRYFLNRRKRKLIIREGNRERIVKLSDHVPYGYAFKFQNKKIYFLMLKDSMLFEVINTDNDSLYSYLKRDIEDSIITAFSISNEKVTIYNPISSKLKVFQKDGSRREIKIPPPSDGLWGVSTKGGSLRYLGGVTDIVEIEDGKFLVSCFTYATKSSLRPLTYILSVPDLRIRRQFENPAFLAGKFEDFLIFISYNSKNREVIVWKEPLSE